MVRRLARATRLGTRGLADLRAGEEGRFLTAYQASGRIHFGDTADSAKQQPISHWSTQLRYKRDVVILALRRDDVADLNRLARREMLKGRRLGQDPARHVGARLRHRSPAQLAAHLTAARQRRR
jgi:hypothetical protein